MPAISRQRRAVTPGATEAPSPAPAASPERAIVDCGIYVDGVRLPGTCTYREAIREVRASGRGFVWIGLQEPEPEFMESLSTEFGIHELITEDATVGNQRPKLEAYDHALVLNLSSVKYLPHDSLTDANAIVTTGEIMIVLAADFVVTVRHGDFTELAGIRTELEAAPKRLIKGPAVVMHAVADRMVDSYTDVVADIENDIDELESALFSPRASVEIEQIYMLKRELVELKHDISPLARPLQRLSADHFDLVPTEIRHYFRDVQDHHTQVSTEVSTLDEQVTSLVHAAVAMIGVRQNTDMRRISAWVAIAAVPTMIAGIYGMNFTHMPELGMEYGYFVVLLFMIAICGGLFWVFRKNRWL